MINAIKRFHVYLLGITFKKITYCDSFILTLSMQNINPRISRWAMFVQSYDYEIEHHPGKQMGHVDALSRCHSVLVLEANTLNQNLSVRQNHDTEITKIQERLGKSEDKFFELCDGLVYRKTNNNDLLFYVPELIVANMIRTCYGDLGHIGLEKLS